MSKSGRYQIDIALGSQPLVWMVDSGLVDKWNWVGLELDPSTYDDIKKAGEISYITWRDRTDASGTVIRLESGIAIAQLIDPTSRLRVGPRVPIYVLRSVAGVPSRVGTAFFHRLTGCRVDWDLGNRIWSVEYP